MEDHADDEQTALRCLCDALHILDRTEHVQVAAITSHALEMLRGSSAAAATVPPVAAGAGRI